MKKIIFLFSLCLLSACSFLGASGYAVSVCANSPDNCSSTIYDRDLEKIILSLDVKNFKAGDVFKVKWLDNKGDTFAISQNKIDNNLLNAESALFFELKKPKNGWKIGSYSYRIFLNQEGDSIQEGSFNLLP